MDSVHVLPRIALVAAFLLVSQSRAADEPPTFKGLGWGSSPDQLKKLLLGVEGWACTSEGVTGIQNCWANGGTYARVSLDRTQGTFSNGKLVAVRLESTDAGARDRFIAALNVKYGDPAEVKTKVAGRAGNTFTKWDLSGGGFVAVACSGSRRCSVSIGLGPLSAGHSPEAVTGAQDL